MTIKELITELLDCPMDAEVDVRTSNKDIDGRSYRYGKIAVDKEPVFDSMDGKRYISILFHNWEFEVKADE